MKKKLTILFVISFLAVSAQAADRTVTVAWDPYTGDDAPLVDRIEVYQRIMPDGVYDYDNPVASVDVTVGGDGSTTPSTASFVVNVPDGAVTEYEIVARGINEHGPSVDSDPAVWTGDQTPLAAIDDLSASYDKQTQLINFSWSQSSPERIKSWKLFRADVAGGPYTEVDEIIWDGTSTEISASQSIVPPAGQIVTYYFVVVAYASGDINSPNSNEISVTIDRRPAKKVINLKVTVD